jgi:endoglycosylceramidase
VAPWGAVGSPGDPRFVDRYGRVVFFHGVNAVEKRAPYVLTTTPGRPNSFTTADAARIASLGFDVVRLGMVWQGLEPGHLGPNDPRVCTPGTHRDARQYDASAVHAYLDQVARVVALLARYHVYTLLDMHEDIVSSVFGGEGAPPWAVCTNGLPISRRPGRWSRTYGEPALDAAADNFWTNDVRGNLQGELIRVWKAVARRFRYDGAVLGYDLLNEPFSPELSTAGHLPSTPLASEVECFYTGRRRPGRWPGTAATIPCPRHDPTVGLIPAIEHVDRRHLLFVEPDIFNGGGTGANLGPMDFPRLVFNFHVYCSGRNPVTGNPVDVAACAAQERRNLERRTDQRAALTSRAQPAGPVLFLSEFGATDSAALDARLVATADRFQLSWTTWTWKSYDDPTGSSAEPLVEPDGALAPEVGALDEPYPQAVAGIATTFRFDPTTERFTLSYEARPVHAPTVVFVPVPARYPAGYCAAVRGGRVLSAPDADKLVVVDEHAAGPVTVTVRPGSCRSGPRHPARSGGRPHRAGAAPG